MKQNRRVFLKAAAAACAAAATAGRTARAIAAQARPDDLTTLSLVEASERLRGGTVSPVDLTRACLARIERWNPVLNAFITLTRDAALVRAREAETEIGQGRWRGPLHGVPIALKDNIDTAGVRTTAASALYADRVPDEDAEVVTRLKAAGAVLLGKLNMHEFAYGGTSLTSHFGPVHNPWKPDHIAGGSSGGSGAAVAAGLCYGALGTDTGGSIRLPASFCGIVGLKGTYGRVSIRGVLPLAWSLDHVGPMTRTVADAAAMLQAIAGYDPQDPTSVEHPVPDYAQALRQSSGDIRVGIPREYATALDPEVESAFLAAMAVVKGLTASIRDVSFPSSTEDRTTIRAAEAYTYHADSVEKAPDRYDPETLARIRTGGTVTVPDYIEARRRMDQVRRGVPAVFQEVDVLVMPTIPILPTAIAETAPDDGPRLTNIAPFNVNGLPALSIPCGFSKGGLPIGLQLVGPPWGEPRLLAVAHAYEEATAWHKRWPPEVAV